MVRVLKCWHLTHLVLSRVRLLRGVAVVGLDVVLELLLENVAALEVTSLGRYRPPWLWLVCLHVGSRWEEEAVLCNFVLFVLGSQNAGQRPFQAAMAGGIALLGFPIVPHED